MIPAWPQITRDLMGCWVPSATLVCYWKYSFLSRATWGVFQCFWDGTTITFLIVERAKSHLVDGRIILYPTTSHQTSILTHGHSNDRRTLHGQVQLWCWRWKRHSKQWENSSNWCSTCTGAWHAWVSGQLMLCTSSELSGYRTMVTQGPYLPSWLVSGIAIPIKNPNCSRKWSSHVLLQKWLTGRSRWSWDGIRRLDKSNIGRSI